MENREDGATPPPATRRVERRKWSDEDVAEMVAHIKEVIPQYWIELEELERTTGDLTDAAAANMELGVMLKAHPTILFGDVVVLLERVRMARRAALGLK